MPPLTPQGPGSHTGLPKSRSESAGLTGGAAASSSGVASLRDYSGSVLGAAPSLVVPILTVPANIDAGTNRFIAGVGMIVFAAGTTNYNSFGMDLDGNAFTVNPLAPDVPSIFQTVGFKAHGFGFGIALGTGAASPASAINVNIGRFGGAGNFDVFLLARLYQFGNQADAAGLNNQYASVLSLNAIPGAPEMDSTIPSAGDLLFSCAATAAGIARNPLQILLPAGPFTYGTTQVDGQASCDLADNATLAGLQGILWNWGNTGGLGSYGNQWVVRFSP